MIEEKLIPIDNPIGWKAALKGINHAFAHTWESCYSMHLTTGFPTFLYSINIDNTRIICPISERTYKQYTDIITPYGFSGFAGTGPSPEFMQYWQKFIEKKSYVSGYFTLNPIIMQNYYFNQNDIYKYNDLFIFDLSQSDEQLYLNLSSNRKRQLKQFEHMKQKIHLDKSSLINFFISNYREFFKSRNASSLYQFAEETLSFLFNQNNIIMIGILEENKIAAVSVFGLTKYMADFLFNISLPQGKKYSVTLIWYALNKIKSMGIPYLNLGGGITKNDSLADFKRRFGTGIYPLNAIKHVYDEDTYIKLCLSINADPDDRFGYFPAYQRPDLS